MTPKIMPVGFPKGYIRACPALILSKLAQSRPCRGCERSTSG